MKISLSILEEIFDFALRVDRAEVTLATATDELVRVHGLNPSSANMTIRSLRHLLNGERYRRALTLDATDYFLGRIGEEYGSQGMRKALTGLSAHIDYRHTTGVTVPGLQTILAKYQG